MGTTRSRVKKRLPTHPVTILFDTSKKSRAAQLVALARRHFLVKNEDAFGIELANELDRYVKGDPSLDDAFRQQDEADFESHRRAMGHTLPRPKKTRRLTETTN